MHMLDMDAVLVRKNLRGGGDAEDSDSEVGQSSAHGCNIFRVSFALSRAVFKGC